MGTPPIPCRSLVTPLSLPCRLLSAASHHRAPLPLPRLIPRSLSPHAVQVSHLREETKELRAATEAAEQKRSDERIRLIEAKDEARAAAAREMEGVRQAHEIFRSQTAQAHADEMEKQRQQLADEAEGLQVRALARNLQRQRNL